VAAAAEYSSYGKTLKQKYGPNPKGLADTFVDLAQEILNKLED